MHHRRITALAGAAAAALALSACSADSGGSSDTITIASVEGWDETVAASTLWQAVLEEQGYDVEVEYLDVAPAFLGVSQGDLDLYLSAWLPSTHGEYVAEFGDTMEELGVWNVEGLNTIAVNADAPIDSLEELAENADLFGNRIVGIEAGAGLTGLVQDAVIPGYGLEGMDFVTSSTPAMLAELDAAQASGDNVAVTLWQPHLAYQQYDLRNLEDPEGTLGAAEEFTAFGREGFAADHPEIADWIDGWEMDVDMLTGLIAALDGDDATQDEQIAAWIDDNREWVDALTSS